MFEKILIAVIAVLMLICVAVFGGCKPPVRENSWDDPNPVVYENADDNIEIEIDFDGYKRKVKKGDYRTGRYTTFTKRSTPKVSAPSSKPSVSTSRSTSTSRTTSSSRSSSRR